MSELVISDNLIKELTDEDNRRYEELAKAVLIKAVAIEREGRIVFIFGYNNRSLVRHSNIYNRYLLAEGLNDTTARNIGGVVIELSMGDNGRIMQVANQSTWYGEVPDEIFEKLQYLLHEKFPAYNIEAVQRIIEP